MAITGGSFTGDTDVLAADTSGFPGITASYSAASQTLILTGSDTLADYQAVLDSVTFTTGPNPNNGGLNPTRTISWVVNDGSLGSTPPPPRSPSPTFPRRSPAWPRAWPSPRPRP